MGGKLQVIVGGQYGSEGKGHIAGYLAATEKRDVVAVRVAGPNAGHSVVDKKGKKWKLQHVPVAAVTREDATLYLAAGSEINPDILQREIDELEDGGFRVKERIAWDCQATQLDEDYKIAEKHLVQQIGSTGEGIGSARATRIMRQAKLIGGNVNVSERIATALIDGKTVQIEGTQGLALGLHYGYYPKCTSSDCRAIDFMSMAGVSPWADYVEELDVWVVLRSYPIRVAGESGYIMGEMTWEEVGQPEEHTTVTKKVRRVGAWDTRLAQAAVRANGGARVAYTFADYNNKDWAGKRDAQEWLSMEGTYGWLRNKEAEIGARVELVGTGPGSVIDLRGRFK